MRVLIDGRPVRYPLAGVGQYVYNLSCALSDITDSEFDYSVMLAKGWGETNKDAVRLSESLPTENTYTSRFPRQLINAALRFAPNMVPQRMLGGTYDVWHSTFFEGFPKRRAEQKLVSTIHDIIFVDRPDLFPSSNLSASRWALKKQAEESDMVITVSEFTKQRLVLHSGISPEKVRVIPLAVSSTPLTPELAEAELRSANVDRPYVLYIGNLEPRKDVPTMLKAWLASKASQDYTLVLAGAPAYLSDKTLDAIGAASSSADIRSLGYVSEELKAALLSRADAFIYPSVYEGFGIPVLEALSYGLPVIACDTSSIPEVLGNGGLLVPVQNPTAMAAAIDNLLGDEELRKSFSKAGLEHASAFSWNRVARQTLRVYQEA